MTAPESSERQTCPRRMAEFGPWEHEPNLDTWTGGDGGPSCSFCGSLHPDRFMELIREGWIVGPTDKNYKAYLGKPVSDEDCQQQKAAWVERMSPLGTEDRDALAALWEQEHAHPRASREAKFYFQHLSGEQRAEFIRLHNEGQMQVGYPGHFYQPPFFTASAPTGGQA